MLEVCLLGTGGMMPMPRRYLTSLLARYNGLSILIDCGEGTQMAMRQAGYSPNPVGIMCFTHYHADHISGLPGMLLGVPTFAVIYSLLRELSETRLKRKDAPHVTASYLDDPPEKDYLHSRIFIHHDEDIPENMMYPPEAEIEPEEPKKPLIVKIEEKAIEKAKSKKKSKKNKE